MSTQIKDQINTALQLHQSGKLADAELLYAEILKVAPENADVLNLLGLLKIQTKQYDEAISFVTKATQIRPCAYYFESLGRAYFENEDFTNAISCYQKSLELCPMDFDVLFNLASAYKKINLLDEAIKYYQSALEVKPNNPDVYFNLGNVYENKNDTPTALQYFQKAQDFGVKDNNLNYFLAVSYLKTKDFENGWKYYEDRPSKNFGILTQTLQYKDLMNSKPLWGGEDITGKTLFVYYEAGLGDSIMYARYLPLLSKRCAKVIFKPQSSLVNLLKDSNLGAEIIDLPQSDLNFDFHIPLMSVPYVLQHNSEAEIPCSDKFLNADPEKTAEFKEKYFNNNNFKIGIKWLGNPAYDRQRIIPIEKFYKLLDLPNTQFYSLQKDDGVQELEKLRKHYEIDDLGPIFNDFTDTAAAIANLDLVICNDTSVAHLVAGLGKSCWCLLPYVSNWRWHTDVSYSPWYKSVKLFKQEKLDDWDGVFNNVYDELNSILPT